MSEEKNRYENWKLNFFYCRATRFVLNKFPVCIKSFLPILSLFYSSLDSKCFHCSALSLLKSYCTSPLLEKNNTLHVITYKAFLDFYFSEHFSTADLASFQSRGETFSSRDCLLMAYLINSSVYDDQPEKKRLPKQSPCVTFFVDSACY